MKVTSIQEEYAASFCGAEVSFAKEIVTSYGGLEVLGWGREQPIWSQGFLKGYFFAQMGNRKIQKGEA